MKKAIIIPSYNAEKTLPSVIDRVPKEYWEDGIAIIIHDCSPDRTGAVADELAAKHPGKVLVEHHPVNRGYGGGLKTGFTRGLKEGAQIFGIVHADGQYAPEKLLDLMDPILKGESQIVQGSRMVGGGAREGGMPMHRFVANKVLTFIENFAFGTDLAEFHSGYMIYSEKLVRQVPYEKLQNNYCIDAEMMILAHILGYQIREIPIPTRYDDEISSLKPIPYGLNVLKMVGRYLSGHYKGLLIEHGSLPKGQ
jgi:glycosyltransferase involved in cell wall biosynthesis